MFEGVSNLFYLKFYIQKFVCASPTFEMEIPENFIGRILRELLPFNT
jgi:hypothetical protein